MNTTNTISRMSTTDSLVEDAVEQIKMLNSRIDALLELKDQTNRIARLESRMFVLENQDSDQSDCNSDNSRLV